MTQNLEQLNRMARIFADPLLPPKKLNVLYALRQSWAAKGKLNEREERILTDNFPLAVEPEPEVETPKGKKNAK